MISLGGTQKKEVRKQKNYDTFEFRHKYEIYRLGSL